MRALAIAFSLSVATTLQSQSPAPDFTETRRLLSEGMVRDSATAAAIAVVRDGQIILEEGFGWMDREKRHVATPASPFQLASLGKTLEATLAAVLQEQGRLDLDRPVNDYLQTTAVSSPAWDVRGTTIRRLLMHTGGLSTFNIWCLPAPSPCRFPSADETIRQFGIVAQNPGATFDYSNLGYFIASEAVARAAGKPLRDLLRDEVFLPLGMITASMGLDSVEAQRATIAYAPGTGFIPNQPTAPGANDYASTRSFASAHDLALFGAYMLKAHRRDQRAILSDASIDSMQLSTVPADQPNLRYGLGWWIEPDRYGYRTALAQGGNNLAQAWLRLVPSEHIAVVLLVNTGANFGESVSDAALAAVLPRYAEGLAAHARQSAAQASAPAAIPVTLDSRVVGVWTGSVKTANGDTPIQLDIGANGQIKSRVGSRTDAGIARFSATSGRLVVRVPGDLEAGSPPGMNRQMSFYLRPRGAGWGGYVTTRPPTATGLDGAVTYWAEMARQP